MMKNKFLVLLTLVLLVSGLIACNTTPKDPLPRSMKGYELYSWQDGGQWHFTLITGTNRNKTLEEVVSGQNEEGKNFWVNIHVTGVEAIKAVLSRVPAKEFVSWSINGTVTREEAGASIRLDLPPEDIINQIKEYAEKCGFELLVFKYVPVITVRVFPYPFGGL